MAAHTAAPVLIDQTSSFDTLPPEILLEIIPRVPYSPENFLSLCLTCRKLNNLIKHHTSSLVRSIKDSQFCLHSLSLFPSLSTASFEDLVILHKRLTTLHHLHTQWLHITSNGPELDWLKGRWETIHKAGLLLLYRLQDAGSYNHKVNLLNSLPATSLACLVFKLISSIKILRIYGPDPIHGSYSAGDIMARSDIELAFEEMLLQYGPDFFVAMLKAKEAEEEKEKEKGEVQQVESSPMQKGKGAWAVQSLRAEIAGMIDRQLPTPEGIPRPPTLTSCLRRAFAARLSCHFSENVGKMWEILSTTAFDIVDEAKMVAVVNGHPIEGGMKRMGV